MDRSANMRAIRSKGMKPELAVRSLVHRLGYRFRIHRKDLPGKPDLVFSSRRKVIFVHGCFWHVHNCRKAHTPKSNIEYWQPKLQRNKARDLKNLEILHEDNWETLIVWECEVEYRPALEDRLKKFLGETPNKFNRVRTQSKRFMRAATESHERVANGRLIEGYG